MKLQSQRFTENQSIIFFFLPTQNGGKEKYLVNIVHPFIWVIRSMQKLSRSICRLCLILYSNQLYVWGKWIPHLLQHTKSVLICPSQLQGFLCLIIPIHVTLYYKGQTFLENQKMANAFVNSP